MQYEFTKKAEKRLSSYQAKKGHLWRCYSLWLFTEQGWLIFCLILN